MEVATISIGIFVFLLLTSIAWFIDILSWNRGICKENGLSWEYFDTDSQGGRGYKAGDYTTWISWPFVDRSYRRQM